MNPNPNPNSSPNTHRPSKLPKSWYRISVSEEASKEWLDRPTTPTPAPESIQKRRIYRWADMWGVLAGRDFIVEKRTTIHQSPTYKVERVDVAPVHVPLRVDDIWEEEFFCLPNIEFNGLLAIVGGAETVRAVLEKLGLPTVGIELAELVGVSETAASASASASSASQIPATYPQNYAQRPRYPSSAVRPSGHSGPNGHSGPSGPRQQQRQYPQKQHGGRSQKQTASQF